MKKGFTLIEMLVVVLIIGILAGIALPQYQMAVTKAKVASILPLMRRWHDAMKEWKLQHGDYCVDGSIDGKPTLSDLGINCPADWESYDMGCSNNYWEECLVNDDDYGGAYCTTQDFSINFYQEDNPMYISLMSCENYSDYGDKVCKALGGKLIEREGDFSNNYYSLN